MTLCPQGHPLPTPEARFCPICGAQVTAAPPSQTPTCARHPERAAVKPCPRCGTFACAECLIATADGERCESCRARVQHVLLPWDQRAELGLWRAFFRTAWSMMFSPIQTLRQARPSDTLGSSLLFAALCQLLSIFPTALIYAGFVSVVGGSFLESDANKSRLAMPFMAGAGVGVLLVMMGFGVLMGLGWLLVNAGLDHLVLRMVGAQPRGFEVTLRASALALSPALCGMVPFCGLYIWPLWSIVLRVFAYRAFHRTTESKAVLGAVLVPAVFVVIAVVGYIVLIAAVVGLSAAKATQ